MPHAPARILSKICDHIPGEAAASSGSTGHPTLIGRMPTDAGHRRSSGTRRVCRACWPCAVRRPKSRPWQAGHARSRLLRPHRAFRRFRCRCRSLSAPYRLRRSIPANFSPLREDPHRHRTAALREPRGPLSLRRPYQGAKITNRDTRICMRRMPRRQEYRLERAAVGGERPGRKCDAEPQRAAIRACDRKP